MLNGQFSSSILFNRLEPPAIAGVTRREQRKRRRNSLFRSLLFKSGSRGVVELDFDKSNSDGVNIYAKRDGDADFVFLACRAEVGRRLVALHRQPPPARRPQTRTARIKSHLCPKRRRDWLVQRRGRGKLRAVRSQVTARPKPIYGKARFDDEVSQPTNCRFRGRRHCRSGNPARHRLDR